MSDAKRRLMTDEDLADHLWFHRDASRTHTADYCRERALREAPYYGADGEAVAAILWRRSCGASQSGTIRGHSAWRPGTSRSASPST